MFNYVQQITYDELDHTTLARILNNSQIEERIKYCHDKVKNIERTKRVLSKPTFGAIEARENIRSPHVTLQVIHVSGRKEMFIKVNLNQRVFDILDKCCDRFGVNSVNNELVYDNSTMNPNDLCNIFKDMGKVYLFAR